MIQQRFTRLFPAMKALSKDERLGKLDRNFLRTDRMEGDLIETDTTMNGFNQMNSEISFPLSENLKQGDTISGQGADHFGLR